MNTPTNPEDSQSQPKKAKSNRKQDILQAMAQMLQSQQWQKITTAALAEKIGFSEAALYRHYRSKAQMLTGLIEFIDNSFILLFKQIEANENQNSINKLKLMAECLLAFSEKNPGLTRVLTGEALQNEDQDLQKRLMAILLRIEEGWKILLREALLAQEIKNQQHIILASMLINYVIGCWWQFSKSGFSINPNKHFEAHWQLIVNSIR